MTGSPLPHSLARSHRSGQQTDHLDRASWTVICWQCGNVEEVNSRDSEPSCSAECGFPYAKMMRPWRALAKARTTAANCIPKKAAGDG